MSGHTDAGPRDRPACAADEIERLRAERDAECDARTLVEANLAMVEAERDRLREAQQENVWQVAVELSKVMRLEKRVARQRRVLARLYQRRHEIKRRVEAVRGTALDCSRDRLREVLKDVLANLVAAHDLLERGGKKAAASDGMFARMLSDHAAAIERARAVLREAGHG